MSGSALNSRGDRADDREQDVEPRREPAQEPARGLRPDMPWLVAAWPGRLTRAADAGPRGDERMGDLDRLRGVLQGMDGTGAPLPDGLSAKMSRLLGADLAAVRLHVTGPASEAAAELGARAFTHGAHIAFAPGAYDPSSAATEHVLAHELVHVVQNQRAGGQAMQLAARMDIGPSGSAIEREAEAGAHAITAGETFGVATHGTLPALSMFSNNEPTPNATPNANASTATPTPGASANPNPNAATPTPTPNPNAATATPTPNATTPNPNAATPTPNASTGSQQQPGATATPAPTATPTPDAPGAKPGGATEGPLTLDSRIAEILEQRADPKLKADYAKGIGQLQVLRLQALQYGFQKSGFGNTLFQTLVFPTEAVSAHWGQIYSQNVYRSGQGLFSLDGLQATIEGLRGGLHILGDLAAIISAWAGMVAIVAALIALIGSETGVLAVVGGAIAAIADAVSIIAGLIKILLDCIDLILGVLQMLILVIRARCSKDPNERARFAQLLHKEANDLATNVVGIVTQVAVLAVTAGVGAGMSKGFSKIATREFGESFAEEFGKLVNPKIVFKGGLDGIAEKFGTQQVGKRVKVAGSEDGKVVGVATEDVLGIQVLKRNAAGNSVTKERQIIKFTTKNQMNGARVARIDRALHKLGAMDFTAVPGFGLHVQTIMVAAKAPDPTALARPNQGHQLRVPEKPGEGGGPLTTVAMWPSQIEAFSNARAPLPGAIEYMEDQYKNAKEQAGPELAAKVDAKLKEVSERSKKSSAVAKDVGADAKEGQTNAAKGQQTAAQGAGAKDKAGQTQGQMDAQTKKADAAGQTMKPPQPRDGLLGKIYNATIGRVGSWISGAQNWLKNMIGKFVMWAAGFNKEDLDLAGIENDMRTDATKDKASEQQASDTAAKDDPTQKAVYELMAGQNTEQQQAIQGMAEAKSFLEALEHADEVMKEAIENGNHYMEEVAPILQHELDTQTQGKGIDAAYISPITSYADAFESSIGTDTLGPLAQGQANDELAQMKAMFPGLDTGAGSAKITTICSGYATARTQLANDAKGQADKMKMQMQAFVGTTDYAGVNANASALDDLVVKFDDQDNALGDELYKDLNAVINAYVAAIMKADADAASTPDNQGGNPDLGAPTPDPGAPPMQPKADGGTTP